MKRLTLIRHGHAQPPVGGQSDFVRELSERGVGEAERVAARAARQLSAPDLILASSAPRAHRTAQIAAKSWAYPPTGLAVLPELYLADVPTLLAAIARRGGDAVHLAVVGHNPGLSELGRLLAELRLDELPTAGVLTLEFDRGDWSLGQGAEGRAIYFDHPLTGG